MHHDKIIELLENRLLQIGCVTSSCEEYFPHEMNEIYHLNNKNGECDLYGFNFKRRKLFIVEVKERYSLNNETHALHQLRKDEAYLTKLFCDFVPFDIIKMIAYSDKDNKEGYKVKKIRIISYNQKDNKTL